MLEWITALAIPEWVKTAFGWIKDIFTYGLKVREGRTPFMLRVYCQSIPQYPSAFFFVEITNVTTDFPLIVHAVRVHYGNKGYSHSLALAPHKSIEIKPKHNGLFYLSPVEPVELGQHIRTKKKPKLGGNMMPTMDNQTQLFGAIANGNAIDSWIEIDFNEYIQRRFKVGDIKTEFQAIIEYEREERRKMQPASLEDFLKTLKDDERAKLEKAFGHSWSMCDWQGNHFTRTNEKENLFAVIAKCDRYVVDSNLNWKAEAAKSHNAKNAFIVSRPIADEHPNNNSMLFKDIPYANNNLYIVGVEYINKQNPRGVMLERIDEPFIHAFDEAKLAMEASGKAPWIASWEASRRRNLLSEKLDLLKVLQVKSITDLPKPKELREKAAKLRKYITDNRPIETRING